VLERGRWEGDALPQIGNNKCQQFYVLQTTVRGNKSNNSRQIQCINDDVADDECTRMCQCASVSANKRTSLRACVYVCVFVYLCACVTKWIRNLHTLALRLNTGKEFALATNLRADHPNWRTIPSGRVCLLPSSPVISNFQTFLAKNKRFWLEPLDCGTKLNYGVTEYRIHSKFMQISVQVYVNANVCIPNVENL